MYISFHGNVLNTACMIFAQNGNKMYVEIILFIYWEYKCLLDFENLLLGEAKINWRIGLEGLWYFNKW